MHEVVPSETSPSVRSRHSVTPCHSGVSHAITSSGAGSVEIGKNVPEKRNIGRIRKRKIATNETSVCVCAAQAAIGGGEREPDEHRDRDREHAERRAHRAERGDDDEVDRRGQNSRNAKNA